MRVGRCVCLVFEKCRYRLWATLAATKLCDPPALGYVGGWVGPRVVGWAGEPKSQRGQINPPPPSPKYSTATFDSHGRVANSRQHAALVEVELHCRYIPNREYDWEFSEKRPELTLRGVLKGRDFFFLLRTARHQPPATNRRQLPAATNRQLPTTANCLQPPTASHQPPPTTTNRHQPPVANCQPPTAANRQPPTATNHA